MSSKSASFRKENVSGLGNTGTPTKSLSAKQQLLVQQKHDSAKKIREEKERLREAKQRKQEEFLRASTAKRELLDAQLEARRMALRHESNAAIAQKEIEIMDRQRRLEQERMHRLQLAEDQRAAAREEAEKKKKEREEALEAARLQRQELEQARRQQQLLVAEEMENRKVLEELSKLEKRRQAMAEELSRKEQQEREAREQSEAAQQAQESRALDEAAYNDMKTFLAMQRRKRRESLATHLETESIWRRKKAEEKLIEQALAARDRELETLAYQDMQQYIANQKEERRQSLGKYLEQQSELRRMAEVEREREINREQLQRQKDAEIRRLEEQDREARKAEERARQERYSRERLERSLSEQVQAAAKAEAERLARQLEREQEDEDRWHRELLDRASATESKMLAVESQLQAARVAEEAAEKKLAQLEEDKELDLQLYNQQVMAANDEFWEAEKSGDEEQAQADLVVDNDEVEDERGEEWDQQESDGQEDDSEHDKEAMAQENQIQAMVHEELSATPLLVHDPVPVQSAKEEDTSAPMDVALPAPQKKAANETGKGCCVIC